MTARDDGGPAFPMPYSTDEHINPANTTVAYYGMSLRDWLAGMAMQGLSGAPASVAFLAYQYADAMLKERAK